MSIETIFNQKQDMTGLYLIHTETINSCNSYIDYMVKRVHKDFNGKYNCRALLKKYDPLTILKKLYPKGIFYDGIVWDFSDYNLILDFVDQEEKRSLINENMCSRSSIIAIKKFLQNRDKKKKEEEKLINNQLEEQEKVEK